MISYQTIQPLIASADADGATMRVTFRCPVAGSAVNASASIQADQGIGSRAKDNAKRSVIYGIRNALSRALRGALGYGVLGSAASSVADGALSGVGNTRSYSEDDKRAAVVRAFENVKDQFVWDAANQRFLSARAGGEVLTDFMKQLEAAPIATPYDRKVAARLLISIACADGNLGDDERQFLASFVTPELGSVDELAKLPPPSPAELAECAAGSARQTMLMLAWAVAFTDERLAPEEAARIAAAASGLGIEAARAGELRSYAQLYVVDQALGRAFPGGRRDPEAYAAVQQLARNIGLDDSMTERADIRFRKRYGIL